MFSGARQIFRLNWVDAQANLCLCVTYRPLFGFLMQWLIYVLHAFGKSVRMNCICFA